MTIVYEYWMANHTKPWRKFSEQQYYQCFALAIQCPDEFEGWMFAVRCVAAPAASKF